MKQVCKEQLALVLICFALAGCGEGTPAPAGFKEACYGGDFGKNLAGTHPIYSAELDIPDSSWPQLKSTLAQVASHYGVKTFDESEDTKQHKAFSVYLCSKDGLFSNFDKQRWYIPNENPVDTGAVQINVFSYKKDERWPRISADLDKALSQQWPEKLQKNSTTDTRLLNSIL